MSWLNQRQGPINHYNKDIHLGTQPVRVIHHMLIYMFERTNPYFFQDLIEQINNGKLNNELNLIFGEEPIRIGNGKLRTPRVNHETKKIELHETFLSYLWCCIYSVFVTYVETIDYPKINHENGKEIYPISQENINKAKEVFNYARYLIMNFERWNKDELPNPEVYQAEKRDYVEQTNIYYTEAVKFILCHEFTHLKLHVEQIDNETTDTHYLAFEQEADNNAIDMMKKGISNSNTLSDIAHNLAIEIGIIFGILSMFFFYATTKGTKHPNDEDRLTNALERLELPENHYAWGIACVGLKMWDEQFEHYFTWRNNPISYKDQYYDIVRQIKESQ
ncbi:hypothetical protein FC093_20195 [Ilyomonas limi]|uniref:Peptidase U49 n=1 Tax=Ilyomonas limi TaxID=2575867 RepID=A0A4U3KV51_9BACT|nr:phage exclusion protein Lit family protein [Ilyomonas limi]TKK65434.1 hypothetical protein FC093_20195 [Ilyomonas limi]